MMDGDPCINRDGCPVDPAIILSNAECNGNSSLFDRTILSSNADLNVDNLFRDHATIHDHISINSSSPINGSAAVEGHAPMNGSSSIDGDSDTIAPKSSLASIRQAANSIHAHRAALVNGLTLINGHGPDSRGGLRRSPTNAEIGLMFYKTEAEAMLRINESLKRDIFRLKQRNAWDMFEEGVLKMDAHRISEAIEVLYKRREQLYRDGELSRPDQVFETDRGVFHAEYGVIDTGHGVGIAGQDTHQANNESDHAGNGTTHHDDRLQTIHEALYDVYGDYYGDLEAPDTIQGDPPTDLRTLYAAGEGTPAVKPVGLKRSSRMMFPAGEDTPEEEEEAASDDLVQSSSAMSTTAEDAPPAEGIFDGLEHSPYTTFAAGEDVTVAQTTPTVLKRSSHSQPNIAIASSGLRLRKQVHHRPSRQSLREAFRPRLRRVGSAREMFDRFTGLFKKKDNNKYAVEDVVEEEVEKPASNHIAEQPTRRQTMEQLIPTITVQPPTPHHMVEQLTPELMIQNSSSQSQDAVRINDQGRIHKPHHRKNGTDPKVIKGEHPNYGPHWRIQQKLERIQDQMDKEIPVLVEEYQARMEASAPERPPKVYRHHSANLTRLESRELENRIIIEAEKDVRDNHVNRGFVRQMDFSTVSGLNGDVFTANNQSGGSSAVRSATRVHAHRSMPLARIPAGQHPNRFKSVFASPPPSQPPNRALPDIPTAKFLYPPAPTRPRRPPPNQQGPDDVFAAAGSPELPRFGAPRPIPRLRSMRNRQLESPTPRMVSYKAESPSPGGNEELGDLPELSWMKEN